MRSLTKFMAILGVAGAACATVYAQFQAREPVRLAAEALHGPKLKDERSKQERIFQSKADDVPAGYVIDRSLLSYSFLLRAGFATTLASLGPSDRWLDIGAGEGRAILDYHGERYDVVLKQARQRGGKKAQAVAMSIEDRRTAQWQQVAAQLEQDQIQYLAGRRLREYTVDELGRYQLVTDVLGGFTYAQNLSLFMENVMNLLELNGRFYTILQHVQYENDPIRPAGSDASFQTEIVDAGGDEIKICAWLKSITCADVVCEQRAQGTIPIEAYRIRKVCKDVLVPPLTTIHFEAGAPPARRFKLGDMRSSAPAQAGAKH